VCKYKCTASYAVLQACDCKAGYESLQQQTTLFILFLHCVAILCLLFPVYAAYGDYIVIWNARTGKRVVDYKLPPVEQLKGETSTASGSAGKKMANVMYPYYPYVPQPSIQSMMLYNNRLAVVASNYGYPLVAKLGYTPVLNEYRNTRVVLFDTSTLGSKNATLTLLGYDDMNGYFNSMRAVGKNLHVATTISLNTYPYLIEPFERYKYPDMTTAEYKKEVVEKAEETAIPKFQNRLIEELKLQGKLPNLSRINLMQTQWNSSVADDLAYYGNGILGSVAQITSLDMTEDMSGTKRPTLSASGSFLPYYAGTMYAADNTIVIAAQGYDYRPRTTGSSEFTYLMAFDLNGASSVPNSIGQVPGSLMNAYAVDVVGDKLRIGTTERRGWWWGGPMPIDPIMMEADTASGAADSVPTNTVPPRTESLTTNYMTVLQLPGASGTEAGEMKQMGQLKLGKIDESFTAIRFFDNVAYAITFLRKDPMYALDLSDASNPRVIGELDNITGFSNYLHSMNDDNSMLLGVGEETDNDGNVLGMMISVFDATNPATPKLKNRYVVENDKDEYSGTEATWDFHAIRYERTTRQLILPVSISNWQIPSKGFNGFIVFQIGDNGIKEKCRISHGDYSYTDYCFYCAYLPSRSFIFGGDVTTVNSQFVRSTDPDTCKSVWDFQMKIQNPDGQCCGYLY
jgi:Beta propeller domain